MTRSIVAIVHTGLRIIEAMIQQMNVKNMMWYVRPSRERPEHLLSSTSTNSPHEMLFTFVLVVDVLNRC